MRPAMKPTIGRRSRSQFSRHQRAAFSSASETTREMDATTSPTYRTAGDRALKDARYAKQTVAFSFDPNKPSDLGKVVEGRVKPIVPVTQNEDEFEPGLPTGSGAPTPYEDLQRRNGKPDASRIQALEKVLRPASSQATAPKP